jgi:nitroimidazol reductase NimA-like FMN-containing flavoprotein (pyridoxamine 5'-phosphate oxidase superfamily)
MTTEASDPAAVARRLIDANRYLTLGTADEEGNPWVSPVWYATSDHRNLLWLSSPEARHSSNLASRPRVSLVIFDSRALPGEAQAVYATADAAEVEPPDLEASLAIYSAASEAQGLPAWRLEDVRSPARLRLFRAQAREWFVLDKLGDDRPGDHRIALAL